MRFCKTKVQLQPIPSLNDVSAIKAEKIMERVIEVIENNVKVDPSLYLNLENK